MKILRDIIVPILMAIVITAIFHTMIASFKVYGTSMYPSILPGEYIMVSKTSYFFNQPQRGDIIVFHSPRNPETDLIKRIIAIPGDTVEIKKGTVFINGVSLSEPYISEAPRYDYKPQEIVNDQYFVLGDNRNNSSDSHGGWTAPRKYIVGKAWLTYWPPKQFKTMKHFTQNIDKKITSLTTGNLFTTALQWPTM